MRGIFKMFNLSRKNDANEFFYDSSFDDYKPVDMTPKVKKEYVKKFKRMWWEYRRAINWKMVLLYVCVMNIDNIIKLNYANFVAVCFAMWLITLLVFFNREHILRRRA